ncbi:MAG TPA: DUF2564 family protein [Anoxybacillus sp.]|nr:DUF2564 family protein [Anoxybacillus sp.]
MEREIHSGYNDLMQVEMAVKTAQKMVGSATMSLDKGMLDGAKQAIADAHERLAEARHQATGVDEEFLHRCEHELQQAEHQLNEALS